MADPVGSTTSVLRFNTGSIPPGGTISFSYRVRVGAGAIQGTGINRAQATTIPGATCNAVSQLCSNEAQNKVTISSGVFTAKACVTGKVFADCNNNHIQDPEELGIPGVRLFMQDGTSFTTDIDGKYSFCGITPNTNVLVVDQSTLPSGAAMTTTSSRNGGDGNSLFLDLKNGDMQNASFAEGSCSNNVIEQIKARRARGEVNSTPTSVIKPAETLKFIGKSTNLINQSTDTANQGDRAFGNGYQAPVRSGSTNPNAK
jgi:SdrD B-like domain